MMLPLTKGDKSLQSGIGLSYFDGEPAYTLTNIINIGLRYPRRAFTINLEPIDQDIDRVIFSFTVNNKLILGSSIDIEEERPENELRAQEILEEMMQQFNGRFGLIPVENPPP